MEKMEGEGKERCLSKARPSTGKDGEIERDFSFQEL